MKIKTILSSVTLFSALALPSFAQNYPKVLECGAQDPRGNTELDYLGSPDRGGDHYQLVVRNQNIIADFIAKGAIRESSLIDHQMIIKGVQNARALIDAGSFFFTQSEKNYTLSAYRDLGGNGQNPLIASFEFKDCVKIKKEFRR